MSAEDFEMEEATRVRMVVRQAVLATLDQMEDQAVRDNNPVLVFEIMALKERLGLPTAR